MVGDVFGQGRVVVSFRRATFSSRREAFATKKEANYY